MGLQEPSEILEAMQPIKDFKVSTPHGEWLLLDVMADPGVIDRRAV